MSATKNTSDYTFAEHTPFHEIAGYMVDETRQGKDAGILTHQVKKVQGLALFGPQGGVITEDDLTPSIVEFIMSKTEPDGKTKTYEKFLVKKDGKKVAPAKTENTKTTETKVVHFAADGKTPLKGKALADAIKAAAATEKKVEDKKEDDDLM